MNGHERLWKMEDDDDDVVNCKDEVISWYIMKGQYRWKGGLQHHGWTSFSKDSQVNTCFGR
jgi:hypothetical protein